jgi:hypothetical protein
VKKASILLLVGLLFGLLCAGRLAAHSAPTNNTEPTIPTGDESYPPHFWLNQDLASPVQFYGELGRSLALDSTGRPHVVYGRFYSWFDGTSWHRERLAEGGTLDGGNASIVLDHADNPHIVYESADVYWYAHRSPNQWIYLQLTVSSPPAIALDSHGYLHLAYGSGPALQYLFQTSQGWILETADTDQYFGSISLALDAAGNPHISYAIADNHIRYAHRLGSQWHVEDIWPAAGLPPKATAIALNNQQHPVIVFQAGDGLKFAAYGGTGWVIDTLSNDIWTRYVSLAIDNNDIPHVAYYNSFTDSPSYATRPAGNWLYSDVDHYGDAGPPTILTDPAGQPHITYETLGEIRYAQLSSASWQVEIVDTAFSYYYPALAIDGTDKLHVVFRNMNNMKWYYLAQTTAGWVTEAITNVNITDNVISLAGDAGGNPHLAYFEGDDIRYAYQANNQWQSDFVAKGTSALSLRLDHNQQPHLVFYNSGDNAMHHAYLDASNWVTETVDSSTGAFVSLKFDSLNQPHLVYQGPNNGALNYAYKSAGQWITTTVDTGVESATLALDTLDRPHLSYWPEFGAPYVWLQYAFWNGSGWTGGGIGWLAILPGSPWTFLAVDNDDYPHLVYTYGMNQHYLKYIRYNEIGLWDVHELGRVAAYNGSPAIALDSANRPIILYAGYGRDNLYLSSLAASLTYFPLVQKP